MVTSTNCPNCGAPARGHECDYCGTIFDDANKQRALINRLQAMSDTLSQQIRSEELFRSAIGAMRGYSGSGGAGYGGNGGQGGNGNDGNQLS